jgi:hypothetical protein
MIAFAASICFATSVLFAGSPGQDAMVAYTVLHQHDHSTVGDNTLDSSELPVVWKLVVSFVFLLVAFYPLTIGFLVLAVQLLDKGLRTTSRIVTHKWQQLATGRTTMLHGLRVATVLVLIGFSLNYVPAVIQSAPSWYSSYQEWRLTTVLNDLSRRVTFAEKLRDSGASVSGYDGYCRSAVVLLQLAQEAREQGDYESAWKLIYKCKEEISTFERNNDITSSWF